MTPRGWFLGLGLFQNMFHNLLIYTNKFCFGYIAVSCFFETFLAGWPVRKFDFNKNPLISLDLDFGLRLRVCQKFQLLTITLYFLNSKLKYPSVMRVNQHPNMLGNMKSISVNYCFAVTKDCSLCKRRLTKNAPDAAQVQQSMHPKLLGHRKDISLHFSGYLYASARAYLTEQMQFNKILIRTH